MGVEPRKKSIRIRLNHGDIQIRETLMLNGKPMPPTPRNLAYAKRVTEEIKVKLEHGIYKASDYFDSENKTIGGPVTVADQLTKWSNSRVGVTASTLSGDRSKTAFWIRSIGRIAIARLVKSDVLAALSAKSSEWSGKTVNNHVSVLRAALQLAVDDGAIDSNVCGLIKAAKHQNPEIDPFTIEEQTAIIEHFRKHGPEVVLNYVEFGFWTGLRTNELMGLRWSTVEIPQRRITVIDGLVNGQMTDRTKTANARVVNLNDAPLAALKRQKAHSFVAGDRVFTHPNGGPWMHDQQFRTGIWNKALKRLQIRLRSPYNMRHTRATQMLMSRVKPALAAQQLGHDVRTFFSRYAKWIPSDSDADELAVMDKIAPALPQNKSKGA
jgi:integrase